MSSKPLDSPPSSDIEPAARLPPSPPLSPKPRTPPTIANRLIRTLRLRKAGRLPPQNEEGVNNDWRTFPLSTAEYTELQHHLAQDSALWGWYQEKVRYDWSPPPPHSADEKGKGAGKKGAYTLRMPTALHERFIALVEDASVAGIAGLADNLSKNGDGKVIAEELKRVYKGRSTTLELRVPRLVDSSQETNTDSDEGGEVVVVRRSPDATFYHPSQPDLPCLVLEVSYSQQNKDLPRLAESYVIDSGHAIRCVVGLNITYPAPNGKSRGGTAQGEEKDGKRATVSVWRPGVEVDQDGEEVGLCRCDVEGLAFRGEDGIAGDGELELTLTDILPPALLDGLPSTYGKDTSIAIPFVNLSSYLSIASRKPTTTTGAASFTSATTTGSAPKKFRKRKRTPSEELSDGREALFAAQEAEEREREVKVDGEWNAGSRARRRKIVGKEEGESVKVGEAEVVVVRRSGRLRRVPGGRGDGAEEG